MLLANCTVAEHILMHFPSVALLRRHPTPPPRQFEPLLAAAAAAGISLDTSSSKVPFSLNMEHSRGLRWSGSDLCEASLVHKTSAPKRTIRSLSGGICLLVCCSTGAMKQHLAR